VRETLWNAKRQLLRFALSVYGKSVDWNRPSAESVSGSAFGAASRSRDHRPFLLNRGKRPADDHLTMKRVSRNSSWAGRRSEEQRQWTILQLSFLFSGDATIIFGQRRASAGNIRQRPL